MGLCSYLLKGRSTAAPLFAFVFAIVAPGFAPVCGASPRSSANLLLRTLPAIAPETNSARGDSQRIIIDMPEPNRD